ncbi:zinc transporter ZIP1-like [Neocloeon triangulifer]|uniref:zinc transporter ZIP1-like n=1 Tax=Neocloeon triangulifer TaxID=2078957 RepID=UPI00286F68F6|nr:zinc transporter ZIP1-like [Neocloeon triangulifer]XP_059477989.1 zinc transporter ZIP1-like [Neocloeon triangulifer]
MGPTAAKWIALVTLGLVSFFLGMIPIKISRVLKWTSHGCQKSPRSQLVLSAMLCFGAGVLLATALTHMLPEVRVNVEAAMAAPDVPPWLKRLPLTEVLLAAGFFLVYGLDELVHSSLYRSQHSHFEHPPEPKTPSSHSHSHCPPAGVASQEPRPTAANSLIRNTSGLHHYGATECHSKHDVEPEHGRVYKSLEEEEDEEHSQSHPHQPELQTKEPKMTATSGFLALVALSIHAVTEGLAIGLQTSTPNVFFLLLAVSTHKFVIAFCLGMEMSSGWGAAKTTLRFHVVFMTVFSGMSALGILIGLTLMGTGQPDEGLLVQALQALAAGTLMYVTFFEVLPRERAKCHAGIVQYLSVLAGFVILLTLDSLVPHGGDKDGLLNATSTIPP